MSIKTSQPILKFFIDLKSSVWFTAGLSRKVGQICADLGPDCSLFVNSTKFSGMTELIMTINM